MRYCYYCKQSLSEDYFSDSQKKRHGDRDVGRCRPCTSQKNKEWRIKNLDKRNEHNAKRRANPERKEYDRQRSYKRRYGITREEYQQKRISQNFSCAICGMHEEEHKLSRWGNLCLDHDHSNGNVRGLLCAQCNKGLGSFKDDVNLMRKAMKYLEMYKNVADSKGVAK